MIPALDMRAEFDAARVDRYDLHARHLNHQMVRVLKTIGFDARFTRGRGAISGTPTARAISISSAAGACSPSGATIPMSRRR